MLFTSYTGFEFSAKKFLQITQEFKISADSNFAI